MGTGTGSIDLSTLNNLHTNLTQHFWFNSDVGAAYGTGVHMTLSSQAEFIANPTGQNILMNTDGISIRNGTIPLMVLDNDSLDFNVITDLAQGTYSNVATFGQTSAQVGTLASGHVILDSNGLTIYNGILDLASFGTDARIGQLSATHTMINSGGMQVYAEDGVTLIANLGYGLGESQSGTDTAPYYTFGTRESGSSVGNYSMAIGEHITASGWRSYAEGFLTVASGVASHAEGNRSVAYGSDSHAEGYKTSANSYAHAEGYESTASGKYSHAEGAGTTSSGAQSHAEGSGTTSSGGYSHAEGYETVASGICSHAEGRHTIASSDYQHVEGKYNIEDADSKYAHIIGNGTSEGARSNAFAVDWDGNVKAKGDIYVNCDADSSGTAHIGQVFNWQGNLKSNLTANAEAYVEGNGSITLKGGHTYVVFAHIAMTNSTSGATNRRLQIFNKTANKSIITESVFVANSDWGTLSAIHMWYIANDTTLCFRGAASRPTTTIPNGWIRAVCIA